MPTADKMSIETRVLSFIRKHSLVKGRSRILVAVSGGPDSVCMIHVMYGLRNELGVELHIAHLNHGLRADESDADAEYVADLSRKLDIPSTIESRDVKTYKAQSRTSLEEAARDIRYNFLAEIARAVGAACVATGHTSDDNAETILMHLLRGSGTRGLRGLQPVSKWNTGDRSLIIVRPLLEISREETIAYCRRFELHPRQDSSNLSTGPLRNRIRHRLLPHLKEYNPQVKDALLRTARISADDMAFIDNEAARLLTDIIQEQGNSMIIDKTGFRSLPTSLKRHLLRASIENLLGNLKDIEAGHIEDIIDALDKPAGKAIGLPGGLNFTIEYDRYVLGPESEIISPFPVLKNPVRLEIPGTTSIQGWEITADIFAASDVNVSEEVGDFTACMDYYETGKSLFVRSREPGDRFQPLGMNHTKKLNEYMIDAKIPRTWRRRIPLVVSPEHIIWVVGWRIDERVRVTTNTTRILRLGFHQS